jgi:hypothetical protein
MHRLTILAVPALLAIACGAQGDAAETAPYIALDDDATQLIRDFNEAKGSVRLLFVVDPTCAYCLRGLDDLNRSLLATTSDPRLKTFVVHVPVIGATAKDVAPAAKLLQNPHVRHYWNASGEFGRMLAEAVELKNEDGKFAYAWDVWLLFGPDAVCDEAGKPKPHLLMHQLPELKGSAKFPRLDGEVFAREARALLSTAMAGKELN